MSRCPKCRGFLIQEEIREHGGLFHGWRCIQCGLRLDDLIVRNRIDSPPPLASVNDDKDANDTEEQPARRGRRRRSPART
jgi:hypothetical protein